MYTITLSPRLTAIAELVRLGARLADIGTDHGYLPAFLLQRGKIEYAVASDIRPGPLDRAVRTARAAGVEDRMRFALADGLGSLRPGEADCVVIAGMGGETVAEILRQSVDIISSIVNIIVQPMTKAEKLREALRPLGLAVRTELLVLDSGVLYPILVCAPGAGRVLTNAELLVGQWELISKAPLFPRYLDIQVVRLQRALEGLGASSKEGDAIKIVTTQKNLNELLDMQRRMSHADSQ